MAFLLFLTAIVLSGIAAYYSIIGLVAIFSAAVIPVAVMGTSLEIAKLVVASWLYRFWNNIPFLMRTYFTVALVILMLITSMGIFGFLSKAHLDQAVPTGDIAAKLALIDEKIKTQRDNVELSRKALAQMDAQVDARLSRSDSEQGAERAVQIRRQQTAERAKLQREIAEAQKVIASLNEERSPIAAEVRKVEAEVGPIKYIAALIYGDNPDENTLERAVRWLIIILIFVFDPLAVLMLIAANLTQIRQRELDKNVTIQASEPVKEEPKNDDAYKIIPDQTVMPMVVETVSEPETPAVSEPTSAASIEPAAPVEKVGVKKKTVKKPVKKIITKAKKPAVKPVAKPATKTVAKKISTTVKKPSKKKTEIKSSEPPIIPEEVKPEPVTQVTEDKSINEGFIPKVASIEDQVQQMIATDNQQGLEQIYKQIVKELAKKNRNKSTHWGPIKNVKNG
jgi:hypothetical protein